MKTFTIVMPIITLICAGIICRIQINANKKIFTATKDYNNDSLEKQQDFYEKQQEEMKLHNIKVYEENFIFKHYPELLKWSEIYSQKIQDNSIQYKDFLILSKITMNYQNFYLLRENKAMNYLAQILKNFIIPQKDNKINEELTIEIFEMLKQKNKIWDFVCIIYDFLIFNLIYKEKEYMKKIMIFIDKWFILNEDEVAEIKDLIDNHEFSAIPLFLLNKNWKIN